MASKKPSNTSLPHANRPKVPTDSSIKHSASNESSMRRNLKRPVVVSSQLRDDIKEQDAIFRPGRSLSNPQDNSNEESEGLILEYYALLHDSVLVFRDECEVKEDGSIATGKKNLTWSDEMDLVLIDALLEQMEKGQKIGMSVTILGIDLLPI